MSKYKEIKLNPTEEDANLLKDHLEGCNLILRFSIQEILENKEAYRTGEKRIRNFPKIFKENPNYSWLNKLNSQSLQTMVNHLERKIFIANIKGQDLEKALKEIDTDIVYFYCPQSTKITKDLKRLRIPKFTEGIDLDKPWDKNFSLNPGSCQIIRNKNEGSWAARIKLSNI